MKRDLEFLYEMGMMRVIPRAWVQVLNKDFANLSEHTFRIMWTSLIIAAEEKADTSKVLKMALVHDIAESRTGDVHYVSRQYVKRDEEQALDDILKDTSIEAEFKELMNEYVERKTLESKIVKDADNLDVDLELREQMVNGNRMNDFVRPQRERVFELLYTDSAKRLWKEIQDSNPHDWHLNGRNRLNAGDWKR